MAEALAPYLQQLPDGLKERKAVRIIKKAGLTRLLNDRMPMIC